MFGQKLWLINHSILKLQVALFDIFNIESFSMLEHTDQPAAERLVKLVEKLQSLYTTSISTKTLNDSDIEFYIKLRKKSQAY